MLLNKFIRINSEKKINKCVNVYARSAKLMKFSFHLEFRTRATVKVRIDGVACRNPFGGPVRLYSRVECGKRHPHFNEGQRPERRIRLKVYSTALK